MSAPIRLTAVLTHPIQYYAPWFRHIHSHAPELALTVLHATQPTPEQQGVGFDRAFEWDIPLTEGYRSVTVRSARPGDRIDSGSFRGLDVPEIGDAIAATSPDVVMITGWYSMTLVRAILSCRRRGIPTLYRGDSHLLSGPTGWRRALWAIKTRLLLRRFDGYLSPGLRVNQYLRWFGVPEHQVFRVPHAVDNELFAASAAPYQEPAARAAARAGWGIDPDAFVALFVGKLVESKRPLDVVGAVAKLGPKAALVIVGSGPLEANVRNEAARLGVDLKLIGFLNQTELGQAYGVADCLALPSDSPETWGLVANEALATGLPLVLSDAVGCAPDLLHDGESGFVYPVGDIARLAHALDQIRQRKTHGDNWTARCRAVVGDFSFTAMTEGLSRACRAVIRHSPGAEPDWADAPQKTIACCGGMVIAGGLERMTFAVLRVLRNRGMAVHTIVNSWENHRITPLAEASGSSWSAGPYKYRLTRRRLTLTTLGRMIVEVIRVSADLVRVSRRVRPTHIFIPDFHAVLRNAPALLWLRARGVRVIARLGNAPEPGRFNRILWRRAISPFVDRFVANSSFTRRELLAHGIADRRVETIPNAVTRRRAGWSADCPRIPGRVIFVGQIIPEKGLDLLLEAIAILRGRGNDVTLDVVGQMEGWEAPAYLGHRASVRERAAKADLRDAVRFLGWREDVPAVMSSASLHCCPSRPEQREGFGIVVLEAKLSGLPSIVTPSGNLPELIEHEKDGWVCARADPAAIAEGLEFFLARPEELERARGAALASAERYSEDRFADAWTRVFAGEQDEARYAIY